MAKPTPNANIRVELCKYSNVVRRAMDDTKYIFREACKELLLVVKENWEDISKIHNSKDQMTYVTHLVHKTKKHPKPKYPLFDIRFYKFPAIYLRAAINFVIGAYTSYIGNLENYENERYEAISNGKKFKKKPPKIETMNTFPVLYKKDLYKELPDGSFEIKLFIRNTWDFVRVEIPKRDRKYFDARIAFGGVTLCPKLIFAYGKYHLDFPTKYYSNLKPLPKLENRRILAVDMGINYDAVCCVMRGDGTIESRHFINLGPEKDSLHHLINKTCKLQRTSGSEQSLSHIYTKIDGIKDNHAKQLCAAIRKLAVEKQVDVVVLEHLGKMSPKGRKKAKIHHWCKKRMQDILCGQLARYGIHYSRVNPANTSALAFDGSGKITRDENNFSICTFTNGKIYNCDLNASYNIGARYFIREKLKSLDVSQELLLQAKVPELVKRTSCTYATYRKLLSVA